MHKQYMNSLLGEGFETLPSPLHPSVLPLDYRPMLYILKILYNFVKFLIKKMNVVLYHTSSTKYNQYYLKYINYTDGIIVFIIYKILSFHEILSRCMSPKYNSHY